MLATRGFVVVLLGVLVATKLVAKAASTAKRYILPFTFFSVLYFSLFNTAYFLR